MSTSRVGRKPIAIPKGVDIVVHNDQLAIKGQKGQITMPLHPLVEVEIADKQLSVKSNSKKGHVRGGSGAKLSHAISGTMRANIANNIAGVSQGFEKKLLLIGVGYRATVKDNILNLSIGFSHPVQVTAPPGITIETPSLTEVVVKGVDKHLVGHVASMIRSARRLNLYLGKGIRYANEVVELKETKKK